ncbi:MAG: NAD(P)H-dependent oxidoreductase, partial [Aliihoeflea sp.]
MTNLPALRQDAFRPVDHDALFAQDRLTHKPRVLMLYGSLRERSYSRFLTLEAARLLEAFGAEVKIFDPRGLPLPDAESADHPKVRELRELSMWSEAQVWCSPERHG